MVRNLFILLFLVGLSLTNFSQLVNEDFESYSPGSNFPSTVVTSTNYQIDQNPSNGCGTNDSWEIESPSPSYWTPCSTCSGNVGSIEYSSSCNQDFTLVTKTFTPNSSSINISFNFGFYNFSTDETLSAYLYNESDGINEETLISINGTEEEGGSFNQTLVVSPNDNYTVRFNYIGTDDWGATIDNILIEEACGPSVSFSQNCNDATNYDVTVVVNSLNGNYVNITNGSNTIESNVGTGTYIIENLSGSNTITVTNDIGCTASENYLPNCDLCNNPSAPSDLPCDAPSVDLSQPFYGSTSCNYTVEQDPSHNPPFTYTNGPDDFCGGAQNDSWLKFTAADDTVVLDWEVYDCTNPVTNPDPNSLTFGEPYQGVQFAIFEGSCNNQDAMTLVDNACDYQAFGDSTFTVGNLVNGDEYFIYIDGFAGDQCTYTWTPVEGVAITPPNDLCANATDVSCGSLESSNNILATSSDAPQQCNGLSPGKGVWYKYTGNGTNITISTDNDDTNYDTQLFLYSGDCDNLVCEDSDDNTGTGETSEIEFTTVDGTEYYIYVGGDESSTNSEGQFSLSIACEGCDANAGNWE